MTMPRSSVSRLLVAVLASVSFGAFVNATPAMAQAPWWQISSETVPTNLPPGGEGQLLVVLSNLGDAPIEGSKTPVTFTDTLPADLEDTGISSPGANKTAVQCSPTTLECSFKGVLYPYEQITITIKVKVSSGAAGTLQDQASVQGGGAVRKVTRTLPVPVNSQPAGYALANYEVALSNEDGSPDTQAGDHPFQMTTTLSLDQVAGRQPVALPKDFSFALPAGLIGSTTAVEQCTMTEFFAPVKEANLCPPGSVVGVASVVAYEPDVTYLEKTVPVFNLVPAQGEPARFGLDVIGKLPIVIDTSVRSGQDYGVTATVTDATEDGGLLRSQITLWGVPGDPRHDDARGWECVAGGAFQDRIKKTCPEVSEQPQTPFLTLPTSCAPDPTTEPLRFPAQTDSWAQPGSFLGSEYAWMNEETGQPLGFEGCGGLSFEPAIDVSPEEHATSTPTGVDVSVTVPQEGLLHAGQQAEADVRDTTVTLPQGVQLSPSAANGLAACPEGPEDGYEGIGFTGFQKFNGPGLEPSAQTQTFTPTFRFTEEDGRLPSCPQASKLGTVRIKTPLLSHELQGAVYLASPAPNGEANRNPFNSLVALYIVAEDSTSGVLVKLAGEGRIDEETLQVSTSFKNAPPVPFEELTLHLFGGQRASLTTPAQCGTYPTSATFTPWSSNEPVSVLSPAQDFSIKTGVNGTGCPSASLAFTPGFFAGGGTSQAGAFSDFDLELTRPDGDQALGGVTMHLPPGIAALLSSVELCSQAQAAASACPAGSEVGQATAVAGLGPEPYVQNGGRVFITGPYGGAPFGLEIVTPAKAGPFDLGYVTVRSKLFIDPNNASVTIVSDPLPTQIRGIPLQLKRVLVSVDRPNFEFNPTNCDPMKIEGTIFGAEGAKAPVSAPFQVGGCASLPFKPELSASTQGHASKADGASFDVKVESKGLGQANIAKVLLQLPKALPARLTTLQKACTEGVFTANPASCPEGSVIGTATIHTPVLSSPLSGPAYLVSHGGAAFPDVEFVLQGEGITLVLDGKTQIKDQITYSKFESAPDAPFTVFETVLPAGPHSALTTNLPEKAKFDLCGTSLAMPTEIVAQNGALINQTTKIAIQGCQGVQGVKSVKLTRAQLLGKALAACRKTYKHSKAKRLKCEKQARKRYAAKKAGRKATKVAHRKKRS